MSEIIRNKRLKKMLNPLFLTQEEYEEKNKECKNIEMQFCPSLEKLTEKDYTKAFAGSSKDSIKKIREITFAICCEHLVEIYSNYDMKDYTLEDMISNAYLFSNDYAKNNEEYPGTLNMHRNLVEKSMEKSIANYIEKNTQCECVATNEIDEFEDSRCCEF